INKINPKIWYLPHFGVVNKNKPEKKVRVVFDAAAKTGSGKGLNEFLLPGPDLLNPIPKVLFRFREYRIGFCGDIKDMFLRVSIKESDRAAQRFLWRGMDREK